MAQQGFRAEGSRCSGSKKDEFKFSPGRSSTACADWQIYGAPTYYKKVKPDEENKIFIALNNKSYLSFGVSVGERLFIVVTCSCEPLADGGSI